MITFTSTFTFEYLDDSLYSNRYFHLHVPVCTFLSTVFPRALVFPSQPPSYLPLYLPFFSFLGHRPPPERELHPLVLPDRQLRGDDRGPNRRHDLLLAQGLQEAATGNGQNKRAFIKAFV